MAFDLATAKPIASSKGFDLSTARPIGESNDISSRIPVRPMGESGLDRLADTIVEPVLTIGSSAIAEPVAGIAGIAQSINPFADEGAGVRAVESTREALTYQPKTQSGAQAVQAIGAALRGESEPLRQYGVLLNDAALKAAALELGIYDGSGALTDQQKILAAQKVIFEQTSDAQGDFARTSDGLANSQRTLTAQIENLQTSIGQALLPVVQAVLPYIKAFADWAADNPQAFIAIAAAIGLVAAAIVATNIAMALNPFSLIAAGVALLVTALVVAYKKFEWFKTGVDAIINGILGAFESVVNGAIMMVNGIIRAYNAIPLLPDISTIGHVNLPRMGATATQMATRMNIPKMAEGGIVSSPTLALWLSVN